jgi:hypothetical protein
MSADPDNLRFFADESALGVGKALAIARTDVVHTGHPLLPTVPYGTIDPVWMPVVARQNLVVLCRDARIRKKPAERALLYSEGLRVFWIAGTKDLSNWDNLVRLVRRWDDLERVMASRPSGPWFYAITETGVSELRVSPPS